MNFISLNDSVTGFVLCPASKTKKQKNKKKDKCYPDVGALQHDGIHLAFKLVFIFHQTSTTNEVFTVISGQR